MTKASGAHRAPTTLALYACDGRITPGTIAVDVVRWLRGIDESLLDRTARRRTTEPSVTWEFYRSLLAAVRRDKRSLHQALTELHEEAERIAATPQQRHHHGLREFCARLAVYRVELGDPRVLPHFQRHAARHAGLANLGSKTTLLAYGALVSDGDELCWSSGGSVREGLVRIARNDLGLDRTEVAAVAVPQAILDADGPDVLTDLMEDRAGIVRHDPEPRRVVIRSVEHLPGTARASEVRSTTWGNPRSEFAPIAGTALPLVHDPDVPGLAAALRAEWPWASDVIEATLADLVGQRWVRFRPTLLLGPPGAGKTRLARRIAEAAGLAVTVYSCAGVADSAFGGTSRQWATGRACVPLQAIKRAMQANTVIVLDEIEKAGTRADNGRLVDTLIPLLEPESARAFFDPYLETDVDLSCVSYIATANSREGIPEPLLDRLRVIRVPEPGPEHLGEIARRIVDEIRQERGTDTRWCPDLAGDELAILADHWPGGSLRGLRRMVERLLAGRETLAARH